ncbi:hypothetical protein QBC43DRAFT_369882 [Cladorrhinum sp. PSN259]|nr:hypothetical protein QBC43DRAFT_369882 [Cladorrhinum sp. PSN259]
MGVDSTNHKRRERDQKSRSRSRTRTRRDDDGDDESYRKRRRSRSRSRSRTRRDDDRHKKRRSSRSRSRSRSHERHHRKRERRIRDDGDDDDGERRHRHHRHHHHKHSSSRKAEAETAPRTLPFDARQLSFKSDFDTFKPLFAYYLDLQKQLDIRSLSETELLGRWKSFLGKWNKGELSEGWYDPEMFHWAVDEFKNLAAARPVPPTAAQLDANTTNTADSPNDRLNEKGEGDGESEDDSEDEFLPPPPPTLPGSVSHNPHAPTIPSAFDLESRSELLAADKFRSVQLEKQSRKAFQSEKNATLEELAPKPDPGSHERKLEKKRALTSTLKSFAQEKDSGVEEVKEEDLLGGGDGIEEHKLLERKKQEKKRQRMSRRDEEELLRREERRERVKEFREREERTMMGLVALARERFGNGEGSG